MVESLFVVVDWMAVVLMVAAAVFVGVTAARLLEPRADSAVRAGVPRARQLLLTIGIFIALGAYLDDGPLVRPWWLQLAVLFVAPVLVAFCVTFALRQKDRAAAEA